ncbi:MAG: hypothetical protein Q4B48_04870 [Syntrophomonadaceae bacterium]|nr:hypothetical protein [Syntrophomonadaceae bacterium]
MPVWLMILLIIVIGLLLIMLLPLNYSLLISVGERFALTMRINLFSLPLFTMHSPRHGGGQGDKEENAPRQPAAPPKAQRKAAQEEHRIPPLKVIRLLLDPLLWEQVIDFLRSLHEVLRPRHYTLRGRIGFDSPLHTARMTAMLALLNGSRWDMSEMEPVWTEDCCALELTAQGKFTPLAVGWRFGRFYSNRDTRAKIKKIKALAR